MNFFAHWLCLRQKKHLDSVEMSPVACRGDKPVVFFGTPDRLVLPLLLDFFLMMFGSVRGDDHAHFCGDRR